MTADLELVKQKFHDLDTNNDGVLQFEELCVLLRKGSKEIPEEDCRLLFDKVDKAKTGTVSFDEFCDYVFDSPVAGDGSKTLEVEYKEGWLEDIEERLARFASDNFIDKDTWDMTVYSAKGQEIDEPSDIGADAFPIKCTFRPDPDEIKRKKFMRFGPVWNGLIRMFKAYDLDNSGYITMLENLHMDREVQKAMNEEFDEDEAKESFKESDADGDSKVSMAEFLVHMEKTMINPAAGDGMSEDDLAKLLAGVNKAMAEGRKSILQGADSVDVSKRTMKIEYSDDWSDTHPMSDTLEEKIDKFAEDNFINMKHWDCKMFTVNEKEWKDPFEMLSRDDFPLTMVFAVKEKPPPPPDDPNDTDDCKTLKIEYTEDWEELMGDRLEAFTDKHEMDEEEWNMKVVKVSGEEAMSENDINAPDDFPLSFVFTRGGDRGNFDLSALRSAIQERCAKHTAAMTTGTSEAAPFLREYFKLMFNFAQDSLNVEYQMELMFDKEKMAAEKVKGKTFFTNSCRPLLEQCFQKHDNNGNGTLCPEEASELFKNLTAEQGEFAKAMQATAIVNAMATALDMMGGMMEMISGSEGDEIKDKMTADLGTALDTMNGEMVKQQNAYLENKAERDKAAFKVVDTSGDGTLQLAEFLAAFEPESERNGAFLGALGLKVESPQPAAGAEGGEDCCVM